MISLGGVNSLLGTHWASLPCQQCPCFLFIWLLVSFRKGVWRGKGLIGFQRRRLERMTTEKAAGVGTVIWIAT